MNIRGLGKNPYEYFGVYAAGPLRKKAIAQKRGMIIVRGVVSQQKADPRNLFGRDVLRLRAKLHKPNS